MRSAKSLPTVLALVVVLGGCGGHGSPTDPGGTPFPLPAQFRLIGSANATEADGTTVSCSMDLYFVLEGSPRESPGVLEYDGTFGGGVSRTILDASGNGVSLQPDLFAEVIVRSIAPDRLEILVPVAESAESRFYRELARFEGIFRADGTAIGDWNCAPLDITNAGGYNDTMYTAPGTWTLSPAL